MDNVKLVKLNLTEETFPLSLLCLVANPAVSSRAAPVTTGDSADVKTLISPEKVFTLTCSGLETRKLSSVSADLTRSETWK